VLCAARYGKNYVRRGGDAEEGGSVEVDWIERRGRRGRRRCADSVYKGVKGE